VIFTTAFSLSQFGALLKHGAASMEQQASDFSAFIRAAIARPWSIWNMRWIAAASPSSA
jgi:hypothetical protein